MNRNKQQINTTNIPPLADQISLLNQKNQSNRILFSAYELVSTKGYANVSLRNIADHAKVVLSQVNYYFKNKEGLMAAVVKMMADKFIQEIEEVLKSGDSSKEKMMALTQYYKDILTNNPSLLRIFYDLTAMSLWSVKFSKLLDVLFEKLTSLIQTYIIETMIQENNHKSPSTEGLSRIILGALIGTTIQFLLNPDIEKIDKSLDSINILFE